ncbi:purine operon repressor PurR [Anaerospora hongkongensis]|uniref:Purine operon repressor PurR n=1 Tax=Anaerospora hongkongensis TaxID=244830 RepID=A0A4R1PPD1_9FIRM|nr:pur operon repressor [Anaerospora hongkongensis]TCL33280.1 purine operon repressor PurR [Anaerospora hongkongensis]
MEKIRRVERVVALTKLLVDRPYYLFPLGHFSDLFGIAKSTLSEDLLSVKNALKQFGLGALETVAGAAGGVRFIPFREGLQANGILEEISTRLATPDRIIAGGFLYMSDILFDWHLVVQLGEIFMTRFAHAEPDYIMTVETKGIPLAMMVARAFNKPLVIVRRGSKVTEGSAVSINYVTGSSKRIQTMSLPKRAIHPGSKVLVIDDFMKAGGTARGMIDLANEVGGIVVGTGVLVATAQPQPKLVDDFMTLLILDEVDEHTKKVTIRPVLDGLR